jgi:hypothetical protein
MLDSSRRRLPPDVRLTGMKLGPLVATGEALRSWLASKDPPAPPRIDGPPPALRRTFTLRVDIPAFGLRQGERFEVCPDAPIYLGDVVALDGDGGGIVLARYRDDLMGCVAGRVRPAREGG